MIRPLTLVSGASDRTGAVVAEELLEQLFGSVPGAVHTTVNPGFFADNYLGNGLIGLAAQLGVLPVPLGTARNAPPSNEDVGRVVAAVLLDPASHAGRRYRPTGPVLLSPTEIAEIIGNCLGRRVRYLDVRLHQDRLHPWPQARPRG